MSTVPFDEWSRLLYANGMSSNYRSVRAGLFAITVIFSPTLAACGGEARPPETPSAVAPPAATTSRLPSAPPTSPNTSAVRISPEIAKACGIKEPDAYFAFDSANLRAEDVQALSQVASCFRAGPLQGKTLRVVGHTDPRGGDDYNMTLGQNRADAVSSYVVSKGLDKAKAQASTRGEMDAAGTDEPTWAKDRRVDLLIGQ